MSNDEATATPWVGSGTPTQLTVDGNVFLLDRETTESLRDQLTELLDDTNDE